MKRILLSFPFILFLLGFWLSGCVPGDNQNQGISTPTRLPQLTSPSPEPSLTIPIPSKTSITPTATASPTVFNPCKRIVFTMVNGKNVDLYTACPDGSNLQNLTDVPSLHSHPSWSPDGKRIAFASNQDGNNQIYIMNEDGSQPTKLTSDFVNDFPIWHPNGLQIAFRTTDGKGLWWWRSIDLSNKKMAKISEPSYDFFFQTPAWSVAGQFLAYMSMTEQKARNDGSSQIHIKNLATQSDTALTHDIWANILPVWSPDGSQIAFFSERDGTYDRFALYVMNKDGKGVRKLTNPMYSAEDVSLSWSPDGQQIVIGCTAPHVGGIYIIDVKTGNSKELVVQSTGVIAEPSWQP